jgi:cytochrome b561
LPPLVSEDELAAKQILAWHSIVGITLSATVAIHISAALFHHFVRRDEVLRRML